MDSGEVNRSVTEINRKLQGLQSELKASTASGTGFAKGMQEMRAKSDILNRALQVHQEKVSQLRDKYEKNLAVKGADAKATENSLIAYNKAVAAMKQTENQLEITGNQLKETERKVEAQSSAWQRLGNALEHSHSRLNNIGMNLQATGMNLAMSFTPATIALGGGLTYVTKKAIDFEAQMSSVLSVMSTEEADKFGKSLEKLATTMGEKTKYSSLEAAQGIEELIKAGVKVEDILSGGLEASLNLATAGEIDLAQAAQIASTALNAFKKDGLNAEQAANLLAGAANASATNVSQMQEGLSQVAAVASGIGLSFKDTSTALAVFASQGLKGSDAGTSLRTMLNNLIPKTEGASTAMMDLGLMTKDGANAFFDAQGNIKSMAEISGLLKNSLKDLSTEQRQSALYTLFGSDAIRAANILYEQGADGINNMYSSMSKVTAADVAAKKMDNLKGKIEELKGSTETAAKSLGKALLPALSKIVAGVQKATDWFNDLSPSMQKTIAYAGVGAVAFTGLATATGIVLSLAGGAISGFSTLAGAITAVAGGSGLLAGAFAALTGPVGLVVGGLALATGAGFAFAKAVEKSKEVNLEHAESLVKQQQSLETLTTRYDELRNKNKLSNDELLLFLDIQDDMKTAGSAQEVEKLAKQAEHLREKSGLSNDELSEMLSLNDKLIEKVPTAGRAFSDQGNAILNNTKDLKDANNALRENIALELELQKTKAEAKLDENLRNQIDAYEKLNTKIKELNLAKVETAAKEFQLEQMKKQQQDAYLAGQDAIAKGMDNDIQRLEYEVKLRQDNVNTVAGEVEEKRKSVEKSNEQISKTQELYNELINLQLAQAGINSKGAEGIAQLDEAIKKTQTRISEINKAKQEQGGLNSEQQKELDNLNGALGLYRDTKGEIKNIQGEQKTVNDKIDQGKKKAGEMSDILSKSEVKNIRFTGDGYREAKIISDEAGKGASKTIDVKDYGKAREIHKEAEKSAEKGITLYLKNTIMSLLPQSVSIPVKLIGKITGAFATGTRNAPGGMSLVGERGPELVHLPKGARVIPNGDTEAILRKWNIPRVGTKNASFSKEIETILRRWNIPMFADGGVMPYSGMAMVGERGRELLQLPGNSVTNNSPFNLTLNYNGSGNKQDAYEIADIVEMELLRRFNNNQAFSGVKV